MLFFLLIIFSICSGVCKISCEFFARLENSYFCMKRRVLFLKKRAEVAIDLSIIVYNCDYYDSEYMN